MNQAAMAQHEPTVEATQAALRLCSIFTAPQDELSPMEVRLVAEVIDGATGLPGLLEQRDELLTALKAALPIVEWASLEQSPPGAYDSEANKLRAAIAKAEGKKP